MAHASLKEKAKSHHLYLAFASLFSLFLVGVLLFSKRSLEPSTSAYTDLSLQSSTSPRSIDRSESDPHASSPENPSEPTHFPKSTSLDEGPSNSPNGYSSDRGDGTHFRKIPTSDDGSVKNLIGYALDGESDLLEGRNESHLPGTSALGVAVSDSSNGFASDEGSTRSIVGRSGGAEKCDLYGGSWVKDEEERYPLYSPGSCPYVDGAFACRENGRTDSEYLKWRWKPDGCELPRFNGRDFLERLRGKRLMLVGDSMNRNQFESLLCILREALPDKTKMFETRGYKITKGRGYFIFQFMDYNCTVEFCRSHFLVREGTRVIQQGKTRPTLLIDRIDKSSSRWKHADVLIFNTGHWWTHGKTSKGKDYYQEGDVLYPKFDPIEAFRRAMITWGRWIDKNMRVGKNVVFYRGYSAAHFRGGDWDSGGTCNGETEPTFRGTILDNYPLKMKIIEDVIDEMQFPVILLNITKLTNHRKDGHPSIYGKVRPEGQRVSGRKQDCSHWCLPGVPDAWNELIYANLVLEEMHRRKE